MRSAVAAGAVPVAGLAVLSPVAGPAVEGAAAFDAGVAEPPAEDVFAPVAEPVPVLLEELFAAELLSAEAPPVPCELESSAF